MVKCLANPVEHVILLGLGQGNGAVQGLEVGDQADEGRERKHWSEGFWFVADWFGEEHERRRDEVFGDKDVEGLFVVCWGIVGLGRAVSVGTVLVHANKIC